MGKDKFLKGALILTVAGLMVKVIGSVNRILLSRLLGGEGIGLYQMAYPIYLLMLSVCSAGVPVAVSIIVAEKVAKNDYAQAHRIFKVTLGLMAVFGLFFALTLYGLAGFLVSTGWIRDGRAYYALVVLTPAVFFSSILASFRGYFQGYQMMTPPAVSQILEQLVRVLVMIGLAYLLLPRGLEYAAAGAAFGAVPGGLTGLLVLTWFYRKARKEWKRKIEEQTETVAESVESIARRLVLLAIPVSCANLLIPVTSSIDMLLVPNGLGRAGFGVEAATTLFGYLTGMAQPLLMMATIPTLSLAASLVPAVSEACTLRLSDEILRKTESAFKICMLVVAPASVARDCPSGSFHCLPGNFPGYYGGAAGHRQNGDSHVEHVIWRRGESGCSLAADIGSGLPYSGCSLGLESEFCAGGSNQYLFPVSERDPVSGQGQPEDSVGFPVYGTGRENGCSVLYG